MAASAVAALALPLFTSSAAQADPKQYTAMTGVGSDTTQFVLSALAGESNGTLYNPLQSSAASGLRQVVSWDATPAGTCITPKAPGATIFRPTGSSAGMKALSRAIANEKWGSGATAQTACGGDGTGKAVSGLVQFARASRPPFGTEVGGTALTYIPFARDGLSFAYYKHGGGTAVDTLTRAQLTSLFSTGPQTINGVEVVPCGIQTNSGTQISWVTTIGITTSQEDVGVASCGARMIENDSAVLKARGDSLGGGKQYIMGMGSGPFISQWRGVATNFTGAGVDLGSISNDGSGNDIGKPYSGTITTIPSNITPRATFYNNATFGRDVYNVVDSAVLGGLPAVNADFKSMFVGATSSMCSNAADTIVQLFGYLLSPNCGSTSLKGGLVSGSI